MMHLATERFATIDRAGRNESAKDKVIRWIIADPCPWIFATGRAIAGQCSMR
jgi:hypothetical protein